MAELYDRTRVYDRNCFDSALDFLVERFPPVEYGSVLEPGAGTSIPDRVRGIENQQNQTFWVDVYIPKDAAPGIYTGIIRISARDAGEVRIPVRLEVHPACMPDELAFFPEMNAYHIPGKVHDFYRLAHEHRCVPNFWAFEPKLQGRGETIRVQRSSVRRRTTAGNIKMDITPITTNGKRALAVLMPNIPNEAAVM